MALRTGLAGQIGISPEGTFGTYVAPTKFLPTAKNTVKKKKTTVVPAGIVAGMLGQLGSWRRVTLTSGTADLEMAAVNRGMGLLLQALMGTTATPVQQVATIAYLQTHTLADTFGKSLTIQAGVPEISTGTVRPYTLTGAKVTDAEFTFEVGKEVTTKWGIDAQALTESQTLVAASYTTVRPFVGTDVGFKFGSYGAEVATTGVRKVNVKIDRSLADDRNYFGAAGLKAEQIINGYAKITGTITADFMDKTVFADRFVSDASFSVVIEAVGAVIASTYFDTLRITLPGCFLDGDTPVVDSVDLVSGDFPFAWLYDGTNYPRIEYLSADVTL